MLSEQARQRQASIMQASSFALILWGAGQGIAGMLLQFGFGSILQLVDPVAFSNLALLLFLGSLISTPIYMYAAYEASEHRTLAREERLKLDNKMTCVWITILFSTLFSLISGILCMIHMFQSDNSRFQSAMRQYKSNREFQSAIDRTQGFFHCCGVASYKDWFDVDWRKVRDDVHEYQSQYV